MNCPYSVTATLIALVTLVMVTLVPVIGQIRTAPKTRPRAWRVNQMTELKHRWIGDFIAAIPDLTSHRVVLEDGDVSVHIHTAEEVAERVASALIDELGLREEIRTNVMSSAGQTSNWKTGETKHHSDMRYDIRYVSDWHALPRT